MSSAPGKGCLSNFWSSKSAGGQLEQPSEVNSSTTTGVSELAFATDLGAEFSAKRKEARNAAAVVKAMRVNRCMLVLPAEEARVHDWMSRAVKGYGSPRTGKSFFTTETQRHREIQKTSLCLCDSAVKRGERMRTKSQLR